MHAHASEYLLTYLQPGSKVLDVGSGSGYLTAIFHHLVSPGNGQPAGKVVGIDHISELVDWSVENLKKDGLGPALENCQIEMVVGDGRKGKTDQFTTPVVLEFPLTSIHRLCCCWPLQLYPRWSSCPNNTAGANRSVGPTWKALHSCWHRDPGGHPN
jgi:SAM-dependent methyltransferase